MKPDWKDAPKWANWLAMDQNGKWCWYENEPFIEESDDDIWNNHYETKWQYATLGDPGWMKTLEQRPKE